MTCIVGLVDHGKVWLGGDSAGCSGWSLRINASEKVFRNGPYVMGYTTSFRMGQILHHAFKPPAPRGRNLDEFMTTQFVDAVRKAFKDAGFAKVDNLREEGGTFLVGIKGRLYEIGDNYYALRSIDSMAAVGCGDNQAMGALLATKNIRMAPKRRVLLALSVAERLSAGVRRPFRIVTT